MSSQTSQLEINQISQVDLRLLLQGQFDVAKWWWVAAIVFGLLVAAVGVLSSIAAAWAGWLSIGAALLSIGMVLTQWRSEILRESAEALLRKIEMRDGLGWPITRREIADILLEVSVSVKAKAYKQAGTAYFSADSPCTPRRMLENLEESTWMTKHLAHRMTMYAAGLSAVILVIAILALIGALQGPPTRTVRIVVGAASTSILVFVFSVGLIQDAFNYNAYSRGAERIHEFADRLLQEQTPSETESVKLLSEYQILRARSPMIPSWLWHRMEAELNTLWQQQRSAL